MSFTARADQLNRQQASAPVPFIGIEDFPLRSNVLADIIASPRGTNFHATLQVGLDLPAKALKLLFLVARILKLSLLALIYSGYLFSSPGF